MLDIAPPRFRVEEEESRRGTFVAEPLPREVGVERTDAQRETRRARGFGGDELPDRGVVQPRGMRAERVEVRCEGRVHAPESYAACFGIE